MVNVLIIKKQRKILVQQAKEYAKYQETEEKYRWRAIKKGEVVLGLKKGSKNV